MSDILNVLRVTLDGVTDFWDNITTAASLLNDEDTSRQEVEDVAEFIAEKTGTDKDDAFNSLMRRMTPKVN